MVRIAKAERIDAVAWTKVHAIIATLITAMITLSGALAQSTVTGADLLVDLDTFIGKEVILTDVEVYGSNNRGALVASGGATFQISAEGIDRETFRQFLKNCSGIAQSPDRQPPRHPGRLL